MSDGGGTARIDDASLRLLVERFYRRVRADEQLGPLFDSVIHDWPGHLVKLSDFWSSVMLGTGRYKGTPAAAHRALADRIEPGMFEHWLALWAGTADEMLSPAAAAAVTAKARRIAASLQLAISAKVPASAGAVTALR